MIATTPNGTGPIIAASYERVSTRMQGRYGFSLGAQHQSLEEFVAAQGWALPEPLRFRDGEHENASGADWDLPDLTRMLEAARNREFQVLAVPDLDRFARSLVKGLVLEEQLKKYGVVVRYQRVPVDDSPEGQLLKNQLFSFAEYERQKTLLRTMIGKRRKAEVGMVVGGGPPPYGYRFTYREVRSNMQRACGLQEDPITGPIARRILDNLCFRATGEIADILNREGIPAARGGRWRGSAIRRMGSDPVYAGVWIFGKNGRRVSPDDPHGIPVTVPALITRRQWDDIQRAVRARRSVRRGRVPREEDPFLLRGFLACGYCHRPLWARHNNGVRYYGCGGRNPSVARKELRPCCDLPEAHAADLENDLYHVLAETLLDPDYLTAGIEAARSRHDQVDALRHDRLAVLDAEIVRLRKRLQAMVDELIDAGPESKEAIRRRMEETEALIGRLSTERDDLTAVPADGLSTEAADDLLTFAAEMREGLLVATSADLRPIYETLQIRGKVYADPNGLLLGRKHRYRIDWTGAIPLRHSAHGVCSPDRQ